MAVFSFTWDTGHKTEVQLPTDSNSCGNTYSSKVNAHQNAIAQILSGDDPTADENSVGYLTDKLAYYGQGKAAIVTWVGKVKAMQSWWSNKHQGCKDCRDCFVICIQCNCHTKSGYCHTTQSGLNSEKNRWWDMVSYWNTGLGGIQTLINDTNTALFNANALIQTQIEQEEAKALVNEIIAETNYQIAFAKGKEQEVEEKMRISKFFTIILPIIIVLLLIGIVLVWRKK